MSPFQISNFDVSKSASQRIIYSMINYEQPIPGADSPIPPISVSGNGFLYDKNDNKKGNTNKIECLVIQQWMAKYLRYLSPALSFPPP